MAKNKAERLQIVHEQAVREFDKIHSAVKDEREQCLKDRRFYSIAGAQWEGQIGEKFENKPKFEVNKTHLSVIRIINEYRNNRISVNFVSKEGIEDDDIADTCDGLYRSDEANSVAEEAYDTAFEEAVGGGFGAWRLRPEYEDEEDPDNEYQRILIEPIFDADASVFFDLNSKRQDKSDAKHCFVLTSMSLDAYEEEYDDDPTSWDRDISDDEFDWVSNESVFLAEYYRVEYTKKKLYTFKDLQGEEAKYYQDELDEETLEMLSATGAEMVKERPIKQKRIRKYIMSGGRVLEDCGHIAGKNIPIIPVYGKRWVVDDIERCMGHVRLQKDSQILGNMQRSKIAELAALSSKEKPILHAEEVSGLETYWEQDNVKEFAFLLRNPLTNPDGEPVYNTPIQYTRAPQVPPAMAALLQITEQDQKDLSGNQEQGEEVVPNISGVAYEAIQNRLDMQSYIYISNFAKAMKRCGEVWLSMAQECYVEDGRKMKKLGEQGEMDNITLYQPTVDDSTGETKYEHDLSSANMDVVVDIGPTSSSKRASTVRSLGWLISVTQDPAMQSMLSYAVLANMDGEGLGDAKDYGRKQLLRMGAAKPTEKEQQELAQEMQNQQPDAQQEYLLSEAAKNNANAQKIQADTIKTQAETDQVRVETAETAQEIDLKYAERAMGEVQGLGQRVDVQPVEGVEINQ